MNQHVSSIDNISRIDNFNFNAGQLSIESGAYLFSEFLRVTGLLSDLDSIPFADFRKTSRFSNTTILKDLIFNQILGYPNQSDFKFLRYDPILYPNKTAPSQSTISRFFDRVTSATNNAFLNLISSMAAEHINKYEENIILDADSTNLPTYGNQESSEYIHHYSLVGYHPLIINEYNSKLNLLSLIRPGNTYSSNGTIQALEQILPLLTDLDKKTVQFRGDSAFSDHKLLEFLEQFGIIYYIRAKSFAKLINACQEKADELGIDLTKHSSKNPYYGEIEYDLGNHKVSRRVVFKAYTVMDEHGQQQLFPTFYPMITNDKDSTPEESLKFYEQRGNSENFTKELKDDFNGSDLPYKTFVENEMKFLISVLSYNLFHIFQNLVMTGDDRNIRMWTFRQKYLKIAGKIVRHGRRTILTMSAAYPHIEKFNTMLEMIKLLL